MYLNGRALSLHTQDPGFDLQNHRLFRVHVLAVRGHLRTPESHFCPTGFSFWVSFPSMPHSREPPTCFIRVIAVGFFLLFLRRWWLAGRGRLGIGACSVGRCLEAPGGSCPLLPSWGHSPWIARFTQRSFCRGKRGSVESVVAMRPEEAFRVRVPRLRSK